MILTKEYIDTICPEHGRTTCSDNNLANQYGGWSGYYIRETGEKEIHWPRCNRCYLLSELGSDTDDLEFKLEVNINLTFKDK